MSFIFKVIFFVSTLYVAKVYAAGGAIPGTPAGFNQQKDVLTKTFNITYPAAVPAGGAAGAPAALEPGASTAIDNWHKTEREFLRNLKENLLYIPEPIPGAGAPRRALWNGIRNAVYARASMTVIYNRAVGAGRRHAKTYTFPYVFSSGEFHQDRVIILDQQAYPFCSYNTMNPNGGNPVCQNFINLIPPIGVGFAAAATASKTAFINSFQDLYHPAVHAVLAPIPPVAGHHNIAPGHFPYPAPPGVAAVDAQQWMKISK